MSKPIHTPGPLEFLEAGRTEEGVNSGNPLTITEAAGARNDVANVFSSDDSTVSITREQAIGNARLLAAAYNAFDSAAPALECNAVELAERMQGGEIARLVSAIEQLMWQVVNGTPAEHGNAAIEARAIITKAKGAES